MGSIGALLASGPHFISEPSDWVYFFGVIGLGLLVYTLWHYSPELRAFRAPWTKYALGAGALLAVAAIAWEWFSTRAV